MSLTGLWRLKVEKCTSQKALLKLMGRKFWEISAIDKAQEDFCLIHFKKPLPENKEIHFFHKRVVIYLDSIALKLLSAIFPLEFDKVTYTHKLVANKQKKEHQDDEKRFGLCSSITHWEPNHNGAEGFTIRWYLGKGILKVFHFVNAEGNLQVEMEMTDIHNKVEKATKIYERQIMSEEMKTFISHSPHKNLVV